MYNLRLGLEIGHAHAQTQTPTPAEEAGMSWHRKGNKEHVTHEERKNVRACILFSHAKSPRVLGTFRSRSLAHSGREVENLRSSNPPQGDDSGVSSTFNITKPKVPDTVTGVPDANALLSGTGPPGGGASRVLY